MSVKHTDSPPGGSWRDRERERERERGKKNKKTTTKKRITDCV